MIIVGRAIRTGTCSVPAVERDERGMVLFHILRAIR
jgi:hypothetical protein